MPVGLIDLLLLYIYSLALLGSIFVFPHPHGTVSSPCCDRGWLSQAGKPWLPYMLCPPTAALQILGHGTQTLLSQGLPVEKNIFNLFWSFKMLNPIVGITSFHFCNVLEVSEE